MNKINAMLALAFVTTATAFADPTIRIMPYNNAKFAIGQYFDIRVEVTPSTGQTVESVNLMLGGTVVPVVVENNGYVARRIRITKSGMHNLVANVVETGSSRVFTQTSVLEGIRTAGLRRRVKNVIFFLGDGMGTAHRTAARLVRHGATLGTPNGRLFMDKLPGVGLTTTHSLNSIVTDSAPGMSGYVSGVKNQNNQEGVLPDNTSAPFDNPRVEYLSQFMHRNFGTSTGIVSTADIEDATPAANMIHTSNRGAGTGICNQYFLERNNNDLRVLMGGGRRWFLPSGTFGSSRSDATSSNYLSLPASLGAWNVPLVGLNAATNLIEQFTNNGFTYAATGTELKNLPANTTKLLGLFAYGNMNTSLDKINERRNPSGFSVLDDHFAPDQPMLDEMTEKAIEVLSKNPNGFVLTVEAAHIDKQSHAMDADRAVWDTIELDYAIGKALAFAQRTPDTMVIVTADHECSGFSINGAVQGSIADLKALPSDSANFSGTGSARPERMKRIGTYDSARFPMYTIENDGYPTTPDIDGRLVFGFGANADRYTDLLSNPLPLIESLTPSDIITSLQGKGYVANPLGRTPESTNGYFIRGQVGNDTVAAHTASDVPVYTFVSTLSGSKVVVSPALYQFTGSYDNIDVFHKILRATMGGY